MEESFIYARLQELTAIIQETIKQDKNDEFTKSYLETLIAERKILMVAIQRQWSEKNEKKFGYKRRKKERHIVEVDEFGIDTIVLDLKEEKSVVSKKNMRVGDHSSSFNNPCTSSSASRTPIFTPPSTNSYLQLPAVLEQPNKEVQREKSKTQITITKVPNSNRSSDKNSPSEKRDNIESNVSICSSEGSREDLRNTNNVNKPKIRQKRTRKFKNYTEEYDEYDDDETNQILTEDDSNVKKIRKKNKIQHIQEDPEIIDISVFGKEGTGTRLGEIKRISYFLDQADEEYLVLLYRICYCGVPKGANVLNMIKNFNGFYYIRDSPQFEAKKGFLNRSAMLHLKKICDILDLDRSGTKEELIEKIMCFLLEPKDSGRPISPVKKPGRPRCNQNAQDFSPQNNNNNSNDKNNNHCVLQNNSAETTLDTVCSETQPEINLSSDSERGFTIASLMANIDQVEFDLIAPSINRAYDPNHDRNYTIGDIDNYTLTNL